MKKLMFLAVGVLAIIGADVCAQDYTIYDPYFANKVGIGSYNEFGFSVDANLNGEVIIVGSPMESGFGPSNTGTVRIYRYSPRLNSYYLEDSVYSQIPNELFGYALSISEDGNRFVVGAPTFSGVETGSAYTFERINGVWTQIGQPIVLPSVSEGAQIGYSVDMSGDGNMIVLGAPGHDFFPIENIGKVGAFEWDNTLSDWILIPSTLKTGYIESSFGSTVALTADGNYMAVGFPDAIGGPEIEEGGLHVFNTNDGSSVGNAILGVDYSLGPYYGFASKIDIALSGTNMLRVVALGSNSSVAYVFSNDLNGADSWNLEDQIGNGIVCNGFSSGLSSVSFSADGSLLALGNDFCNNEGQSYIYQIDPLTGLWFSFDNQAALYGPDGFGKAIALSGDGSRVVVGSPNYIDLVNDNDYIHVWTPSTGANLEQKDFAETEVVVFPNPANQMIEIKSKRQVTKVIISNDRANMVMESDTPMVNVADLPEGLYLVTVHLKNGQKEIQRVKIEK